MDPVKESFRLNLVELFEKSGKKSSDLAKACGVGKSAVSNWTTGKSSIDVERIPAICEFFGITIGDFFGRADELDPTPELSKNESELIALYRSMPETKRSALINIARAIVDDE